MKTASYFLSLCMIAFLIGSSACTKKSTDPQDEPPSITLQTGGDYVSSNKTVTVSSALKFGIRANPNSNTGANLTGLTFARTFNGHTQTYDTTINVSAFNVDLSTAANIAVGNETLTFTIKDAMGASSSVQVVVTTIAPTLTLQKMTANGQRKDEWTAR